MDFPKNAEEAKKLLGKKVKASCQLFDDLTIVAFQMFKGLGTNSRLIFFSVKAREALKFGFNVESFSKWEDIVYLDGFQETGFGFMVVYKEDAKDWNIADLPKKEKVLDLNGFSMKLARIAAEVDPVDYFSSYWKSTR